MPPNIGLLQSNISEVSQFTVSCLVVGIEQDLGFLLFLATFPLLSGKFHNSIAK